MDYNRFAEFMQVHNTTYWKHFTISLDHYIYWVQKRDIKGIKDNFGTLCNKAFCLFKQRESSLFNWGYFVPLSLFF